MLIYISIFIGCLVEIRYYNILSLAFNASSNRVTEENLVFETIQSGIYLLSNVFSAVKEAHFYIVFVVTAAGVLLCGSPKKPPRTSSIVQFIFFGPFRSAEIL